MRKLLPTLSVTAALSAIALWATPAHAWGERAHAVVDLAALATLPADGPLFLRKYADYIAASSSLPDTWRATSEPFSKIAEDPNHGWFREQFTFLKPIPRSRHEFILALYREYLRIKDSDPEAAQRTNVRWTGTLPYAAMESYGRLVAGMRRLRAAQAAGEDTRVHEQNCAYQVAVLGHYIGDGSQPLHDSVHSDGWRGPNPHGYTRDRNIHGRFEGKFVDAIGLEPKHVVDRVAPPSQLKGDLFVAVLKFLDTTGDRLETVYQLEKRGALENPADKEARAFVYQQVASGVGMLRDMIYTAWLESAQPPAKVAPDPLDPANPAYNAETGTAPAYLSR